MIATWPDSGSAKKFQCYAGAAMLIPPIAVCRRMYAYIRVRTYGTSRNGVYTRICPTLAPSSWIRDQPSSPALPSAECLAAVTRQIIRHA